MDFSYSEEQGSIVELAGQILRDGTSQERLREVEASEGPRFDRELWQQLADAGLLAVAIPEEFDGAGLGFLEVGAIVEQVGRTAAPVPFLESIVLGALPLAEFGSEAQKRQWLPRIGSGEAILTAALSEAHADPHRPTTTAAPAGAGFRLDGSKLCVPAAELADALLVPATTPDGATVVALVDATAEGVAIVPLQTTSGQPEARVDLAGVAVAADQLLGDAETGAAVLDWMLLRANAALANLALGVCEEALELTAEYAKTRKQFDQPIAMFQAVGHRAADAYVDVEAIRLTTLQATWRIAAGRPAAMQVAVAKHFACEAGQRVVHAAQHLHGGIGVDTEYPLHRMFLYAKQLELTLGGSTQQLLALGDLIAAEAEA